MRAIAGLILAGLLGAAGCADGTGIVLTVAPADEGDLPALAPADTIEVYVGFGDSPEDAGFDAPVRIHLDDGNAGIFDVGSYTGPVDVMLTGRPYNQPFFVAVRLTHNGAVVAEGGVPAPLTFVDGMAQAATALVAPVMQKAGYQPNCPGFSDGTAYHYVVGPLRDDDCDNDGEIKDNPDCNDFDKSFNTRAMDTVCDGVDHTCGANPVTTTVPCVAADAGTCYLGNRGCNDVTGPVAGCMLDNQSPLPAAVCTECMDAMSLNDLVDCLPNSHQLDASCTVIHADGEFCLPPTLPVLGFSPTVWWHDGQPQGGVGRARWFDLDRHPDLDFLWVNPTAAGIATVSTEWPPSPAIQWDGVPLPDQIQLTKFAAVRTNAGTPELWIVDFDIRLADTCPAPSGNPDCTGLPTGAGAN